MKIEIQRYSSQDCHQIIQLFYQTVHSINRRDYSEFQCSVWAPEIIDCNTWDTSLSNNITYVAFDDTKVVGFGDITKTGYLDRLYVHHQYQSLGIGSKLYEVLESAVHVPIITVHASITAYRFFEEKGFVIQKEQQVFRKGVSLTNFVMQKNIR